MKVRHNWALMLGILFTCITSAAQADFMPPNQLHWEDSLQDNSMTETRFNELIDAAEAIYAPVITGHGATLSFNRLWDNATVNASASQSGSTWVVNMYGGLARRNEVTEDGFSLVICHEIGHHLGGYAFYGEDWAASEGQSDYFATQACGKLLWQADLATNATFRSTAPQIVRDTCDSVYNTTAEQDLCYRQAMAGKSLGTLLAALGGAGAPDFGTPDTRIVSRTSTSHPAAQCRLDTYFQGALCSASLQQDVIPGRNNPDGQTSPAAEAEAMANSCSRLAGYSIGVRPLCWFSPLRAARLVSRSLVVDDSAGNGNGYIEPGETIALNASLSNSLGSAISGATLNLSSQQAEISVSTATTNYPDIADGDSQLANDPVTFDLDPTTPCGTALQATLRAETNQIGSEFSPNLVVGRGELIEEEVDAPNRRIPYGSLFRVSRNLTLNQDLQGLPLEVDLAIDHPRIGDLEVELIAPNGQSFILHNRTGGRNDDIAATYKIAYSGDARGRWRLVITDHVIFGSGRLTSWSLKVLRPVCS